MVYWNIYGIQPLNRVGQMCFTSKMLNVIQMWARKFASRRGEEFQFNAFRGDVLSYVYFENKNK